MSASHLAFNSCSLSGAKLASSSKAQLNKCKASYDLAYLIPISFPIPIISFYALLSLFLKLYLLLWTLHATFYFFSLSHTQNHGYGFLFHNMFLQYMWNFGIFHGGSLGHQKFISEWRMVLTFVFHDIKYVALKILHKVHIDINFLISWSISNRLEMNFQKALWFIVFNIQFNFLSP